LAAWDGGFPALPDAAQPLPDAWQRLRGVWQCPQEFMQWLEKFFLRRRGFSPPPKELWQRLRGVWQGLRKLAQRLPNPWQCLPEAQEWPADAGTSRF